MEIKGEKTTLTPIEPHEKEEFFILATKSFGANFWYDDEEIEKKSFEKFLEDWKEGYFDMSKPYEGQCFWILLNGVKIGAICYNKIDKRNKRTELDIIIGDEENLGKGYGPDALKTLINYLFKNLNINKVWIEGRANNERAIKAYEKAGFKREGLLREEEYFKGKFIDCVIFGILRKDWNKEK